ncbi:MAG TPA: DNA polymerase III subunit delta [Gemmatimonadales bacterium]|nr:DNA polymerase III subunit delta [Gemmatimonadales bacterium]
MPAHSPDALFRSLNKGELEPVYYLHGSEDVLKDEAVRAIVDRAVDPSLRDFNFDQRSAAQLGAEEVNALCNTLPMLADRRVVVLRDVEGWKRKTKGRAELLRYLAHPSQQTVVVMVQGADEENEDKELAAGAYAVRFDPLPADRARKWLLHRAGKLGLELDPAAAEHLVLSVGSDLGALASELEKLASLPAGEPLTAERVGELVGVRHGETLWDWRDAVLGDQPARAATLLTSVLAQPGVTGVKLVSQLGTALVGIGIARAHYDRGARAGALEGLVFRSLLSSRPYGLPGYKEEARRWSRWALRWPSQRIRAALEAARDADEALKSTSISDERGVLTDLVLRIAQWKDGEDTRMAEAGSHRGRHLAGTMLSALAAFSVFAAPPLRAQTDPRLLEAVRYAQEGKSDSARMKVRRVLAATAPSDTLYPQIIYTQAMVASDANEMRRQLQRVAVEYSSSSWADEALLRLVQLDYASGNLDGAARNLERIRRDYPGSPLLPHASYWAARTYFDQKNTELACRWLAEGLAGSAGNIELRNQLSYLDQRCAGVRAAIPSAPPRIDSPPAVSATKPDTAPAPARPGAAAPVATPSPTAPPAPAAAPAADTARPTTTTTVAGQAPPAAARFRIQITAVRTLSAAESIAKKTRTRGLEVHVLEEGGLYKVRVGGYATRTDATADVPKVKAQLGGSPFVVAEP